MKSFWLKFHLFCLSVVFFIGGMIFVLNIHADNLIQGAPTNVEAYFHGDPRLIGKLPAKQFEFIYDWLVAKSGLQREQWQSALKAIKHETAIFTLNRQAFGLAKKTEKFKSILDQNKISYAESGDFIYFPSLNVDALDLSGNNWIEQSRKKINFADVSVALKNLASLNIPASAGSTEPVVALAYLSKSGIKINIFGQTGTENVRSFKPNIANIPNNASLYFQGLEPSAIGQKAPYSVKNFNFLLLQALNGPVEYLETDKNFIVYALKTQNNVQNIENAVLTVLANIAPRRIVKTLPDSTKSVQLIADPSAWKFTNRTIDGRALSTINEPSVKIDLKIINFGKFYIITNNLTNVNDYLLTANTKTDDLLGYCLKFSKRNLIYINPSSYKLDKYIDNIVVLNQNPHKITVCLH